VGRLSPNWIHSASRPFTGLLYLSRVIVKMDNLVQWIMAGETEVRRKPAPVPLCPPQIPLDQTRARTWAAAVWSQWLTAWAMERPSEDVFQMCIQREDANTEILITASVHLLPRYLPTRYEELRNSITLTYKAAERTCTYSKHISRDRYPASPLTRRSDLQKAQLPLLLRVEPCLQSCSLATRWSHP
jgi:hypothetical protein